MDQNTPKRNNVAIVFGSKSVNAVGLIRSLGEAGFSVTFASTYSKIESRYTSDYLHLPQDPTSQISALTQYIRMLPGKPAIFPTDDASAFLLDEQYRIFDAIAFCPHAKGRLRQLADKAVMSELAIENGLHVASFQKVRLETAAEPPVGIPCILKPYAGYAGSKGDIRLCHTKEEYSAACSYLMGKNYSSVMVQQLLEGTDQYEIGLMGLALPDGRVVIPGTIRKYRSWPNGRGSTTFAQLCNGLSGVSKEQIASFVRATGYIGIFDIEMIVSEGTPYFIEINYRNGQYGYAPTAAGYNIPANWFRGMRQEPVEEATQIREIYYMNEREDFLHIRAGDVSFRQWLQDFRMAKAYGMYCRGDQRPFVRQWVKIPDRVNIFASRLHDKLKEFFIREEWCIAIRPRGENLLFEENGCEAPFRVLHNSFRYWCADPFVITVKDKDYLFFEMFDRFRGKGVIGYRVIDVSGHVGKMQRAYETNNHLSFPCIFEQDGQIYMMPESSYDRNLTLLRAEHFPDKWEVVHTWFSGQRTCDSVPFEHNGKKYLLTQPVDIPYTNAKLELYTMKNGQWIPCAANPVIDNNRVSRMAGRVFEHNGMLIRPSQDCGEDTYGDAVNFNEITQITQNQFREILVCRITPDCIHIEGKLNGFGGIHTYNHSKRYEVVDLKMRPEFHLEYSFGFLGHKAR